MCVCVSFMASVLDANVVQQLAIMRRVATALCAVSSSSDAFFSVDDSELTVSHTSVADTVDVLVDVGKVLAAAIEALASAAETQLTEFFEFMRQKKTFSAVGIFDAPPAVPDDPKVMNPQDTVTTCAASFPRCSELVQFSSDNRLQNAPLTKYRRDQSAAVTSVQTCLFLMMESVLTRLNATRAAVYLGDSVEKLYMLCRVAHIYADDMFPPEICCIKSNSLLATVAQCGIAVNFDNTQTFSETNQKELRADLHSLDEQTRHFLNLRSGVIVPIGKFGCVVFAEKPVGVSQVFTSFDEHLVWSFAILCEGLFLRYPCELFVNKKWNPPARLLRKFTRLPSISRSAEQTFSLPALHSSQTTALLFDDALLSAPQKLSVVRAKGRNIGLIPGRKGAAQDHLTHEELFQDAIKYVFSVESLLLDSTREVCALQQKIANYHGCLDEKESRIVALEAKLRRLHTRSLFSRRSHVS